MEKELPRMYQNKIKKNISNVQKVYSSMDRGEEKIKKEEKGCCRYPNVPISKKIDDIFSSYDYVYKADVTIVTDQGRVEKRIVARDSHNLITIDNEYIPISIIRDIYK